MDMEQVDVSLPTHPATGLRAVGVLASGRVVWPVLGAAPDDADAEGTENADTDSGDETQIDDRSDDRNDEADDTGGGDDQPDAKDQAKTEKAKAGENGTKDLVSRAELRKAISERQKAKQALRKAEQERDELKAANEGAEEKAARQARQEAAKEVEAKYKPLVVRTSARAAMLTAGIQPDKADKAIRLLNVDDLEVDDDGEVTGLAEQIEELKTDWPELFTPRESDRRGERRGSRSADGADKRPPKPKPLTASERQAAQLLGKL